MADTPKITVLDVDKMHGDLLINFSNGAAVLFDAQFLWSIRDHDGNVAIPEDAAEKDEAIILPD